MKLSGRDDWTPMKLHYSSENPSRLFVETKQGLWVIGLSFTDIYIYFYNYINLNGNIAQDKNYYRSILNYGHHLLIIEATTTQNSYQIMEYNLANAFNETKIHSFNINGHTPIFPFVASNSDTN